MAWPAQIDTMAMLATYGYAALFTILFLEEIGVPLPVPGDLALLIAGYLVGRGALRLDLAVFTVVLAALAGASGLYLLTLRYGRPLVVRYGRYLHLNERRLSWLEAKFRRHGSWAILVARVTPGMRIYTSILAGLGRVPYFRFLSALGPASVLWAVGFIYAGSRVGEGWDEWATLLEHHALRAVLLLLALSIFSLAFREYWRRARWRRSARPDNPA